MGSIHVEGLLEVAAPSNYLMVLRMALTLTLARMAANSRLVRPAISKSKTASRA